MRTTAVAAILFAFALPLAGAEDKWFQDFVKHWKTAKEFTVAVAEAMPAEHYDFKPNPEQMSFAELMAHIAGANAFRFAQVAGTTAPLGRPAKLDKAAAIKMLNESFDHCAKVLDRLTEQQLENTSKVDWLGMPEATGREILWNMFTHTAHHRAQAEVYLRLKNIKPPQYRF